MKAEIFRDWRRKFTNCLVISDLVILLLSAVFSFFLKRTNNLYTVDFKFYDFELEYFSSLLVFCLLWFVILGLFQTRSSKVLGAGPKEYGLVTQSSLLAFATTVFILFLMNADFSRQILISFFSIGTIALVFSRWAWRRGLNKLRKDSGWKDNVILVGPISSVVELSKELLARYQTGLNPAGFCLTGNNGSFPEWIDVSNNRIPVLGNLESVRSALDTTHSTCVIISEKSQITQSEISDIAWSLDADKHELVLSQGLIDVSGPRIHMRPLAGLPFVYVEVPNFIGAKRFAKRMIDLFGSLFGIMILFVPGLIVSVAIWANGKGPIFFVQERVGRNNTHFKIYKFRTMNPDAEKQKEKLLSASDSSSPLFKLTDDPRVTRIGKFLRKWSIDEIPQLVNVLIGNMSLVGPRPPLQSEVDLYDDHVHRKFLVKPGITGLWQISGRSNLSWEDSVRLDLYYVENWSITTDFIIMFRTISSVLKRDGAY